jgi:hypothetical protein
MLVLVTRRAPVRTLLCLNDNGMVVERMKEMNRKYSYYSSILLILFLSLKIFPTQNVDTMKLDKMTSSVLKQDSTNPIPNFEYKVMINGCHYDEKDEKYSVLKNTLKVQYCGGGCACKLIFKLIKQDDTLHITRSCAPRSEEQHILCFCVYCKISGLKKGVYILKYDEGFKANIPQRIIVK